MPGTLYVVATPIGHLKDITLRALETLRAADSIACEDTRVTSKLLQAYDIYKPLLVLHEHTTGGKVERVIEEIRQGRTIAYVCDAGTPGMNDPGGKLAAAAYEAGIRVEPVPGPSALTAVISACGFPMDDFSYVGFVPHKKGRKTFFEELAARREPVIFLESTHRIAKCLDEMAAALEKTRLVCVCRELTKMHETIYRGTADAVRDAVMAGSTKGEFTLVVGPRPKG